MSIKESAEEVEEGAIGGVMAELDVTAEIVYREMSLVPPADPMHTLKQMVMIMRQDEREKDRRLDIERKN